MIVIDYATMTDVMDIQELETVLRRRHDNNNAFLLSEQRDGYPQLYILVKGDLATLTFESKDPGMLYRSAGSTFGLNPNETTPFAISLSPTEEVPIINDSIVHVAVALAAAKQFFLLNSLPTCVTWLQL